MLLFFAKKMPVNVVQNPKLGRLVLLSERPPRGPRETKEKWPKCRVVQ